MHPKGRLIIWDSMPLAAYGVTHQGRRSTNEDSWLVDLDLGLLVVADGMGGHNAGEVASALAVQVIRDVFAGSGDIPREALLTHAVQSANERILTAAAEQPAHSGMGTTVVAVVVVDDRAFYTSVGDSRVYLWRGGRLTQLTRDDSWLAETLDGAERAAAGHRYAPDASRADEGRRTSARARCHGFRVCTGSRRCAAVVQRWRSWRRPARTAGVDVGQSESGRRRCAERRAIGDEPGSDRQRHRDCRSRRSIVLSRTVTTALRPTASRLPRTDRRLALTVARATPVVRYDRATGNRRAPALSPARQTNRALQGSQGPLSRQP